VRATDTLTISLPAAMAEQMKKVQKKENRTRSELVREAWRQYFENHYGSYMPTKSDLSAIRKGRAEISQGHYVALQELLHDLDHPHRKTGRKAARKISR
jgi:metal-responsive CopG/Arc/MetJ family transcriptional regulator